jgi:hypothetical protein
MSAVAEDGVLIDVPASTLAFRAGQVVEGLLLDRGAEVARRAGGTVVRVEHVRPCIDETLLDQLRKQLDEQAERGSRDAA